MLTIKQAFENISEDEFNQLLDTPVWLSLLAAYAGDGKVSEDEKAEAVKLAHMRTYSAPKSLREFYKMVDARFELRFEILNNRLPEGSDNIMSYIKPQVQRSHDIILTLDRDVAETLEESLSSFYRHVFKADKSFFQYFALPVVSSRLEKHDGNRAFNKK